MTAEERQVDGGAPPVAAVDRLLDRARAGLRRVLPRELPDRLERGALLVDIRPEADRARDGELDDAVVVERIHLEWRVDPTSPDRLPGAEAGRQVIVVCNEGYASSLAAATLRNLGVDATDVIGGYRALAGADRAEPVPDRA